MIYDAWSEDRKDTAPPISSDSPSLKATNRYNISHLQNWINFENCCLQHYNHSVYIPSLKSDQWVISPALISPQYQTERWWEDRVSSTCGYCLPIYQSYNYNKCKDRRENEPFDPWEWLVSHFSLQYHHWIAHDGHENKANDQQLKKLLIIGQILLDSALGNT